MKTILCIGMLTLMAGPHAFGLVRLGEGQIDFNLQLESAYDTEIRARNSGEEDFIFTVRPSLVYSRSSKNIDISASVGFISRTYLDYDEYSDTDVSFDLSISPNAEMRTSRIRSSASLILNTETRADDATGEIITVQNYGARGQVIYDPNRFYDIIGGVSYNKRDPDSDISSYTATETTGVSLSILVPRSEFINWSAGIEYQDSKSDRGLTNGDGLTYFVGLSGRLLPKLSGNVSVGIQDRSYDTIDNQTSPYLSAGLTWQVDDLSSVNLTASQGLGTTLDDRASENLEVRLSGNRQLSRDLSGSVYLGYSRDQYDSSTASLVRDDKEYFLGGSLQYKLVRWGSIGVDVRYSDQSSSQEVYEFDRLRAGVNFSATW